MFTRPTFPSFGRGTTPSRAAFAVFPPSVFFVFSGELGVGVTVTQLVKSTVFTTNIPDTAKQ